MYRLLLLVLVFLGINFHFVSADNLEHLAGRIVLQVENNGEAWYVSPDSLERFFLGRPSNAFDLMRKFGIGISNSDLEKIPIALDLLSGIDSDQDGLPDEIEKSVGTDYLSFDSDDDGYSDLEELATNHDPRNEKLLPLESSFVSKNLGKIFLQVEKQGQAWYVFPGNGKRYYLGRPSDAFNLMSSLGLGISDDDLENLVALSSDFNLTRFERKVHDLVNKERTNFNLQPLTLNEELSRVAREHSDDLAKENEKFTGLNAVCSYPLIHHEGLYSGIYQSDRLANNGIKYYNMSGENIVLLSAAEITLTYQEGDIALDVFEKCKEQREEWDSAFKERIDEETDNDTKLTILKNELEKRKSAFAKTQHLEIANTKWEDTDKLAERAVEGWMNSPGHRENILRDEYNEAGIGIAYVNSYVIITQVFIRKIACGYEGASCCEQDNYLVCYEPNTCVDNICK